MKPFGPAACAARVGIVADTHVGEHLSEMPPAVIEALAGVDLILHAGDVIEPATLEALRAVAPVIAVQGNHDREAEVELPRTAVIAIAGATIGLVHGDRPRPIELLAGALSLASGRIRTLGLEAHLVRAIGEVDVVVFGHLHQPVHRRLGSTLVFSPGGVYQPEIDPGYSWSAPAARVFAWYRRRIPAELTCPSVGVLDIENGEVRAQVVRLPQPLLPSTLAPSRCHCPAP